MKKFIFSILLVFIGTFCSAQKIRYNTMKCTISKGAKDSIQKMAKYELDFYRSIFTIDKIPTVTVKLYGTTERFKQAEKNIPRWNRSKTGFYMVGRREVAVLKDVNFIYTAYHEINHFIFHTQFKTIPTWVDEGLSCYFENAKFDSTGNVVIQPWRYGKYRLKELFRKNKISVERMAHRSHKKFHTGKELDHYVEAWAVVYFLMETNKNVMIEIIRNNTPDAIEMCYKGGMAQLQKDVTEYYK